jgi:rubrerythrin
LNLTADTILQVAIELERRGRTFYDSLAAGCGDKKIGTLAISLAKEEGEHILAFKQMLNSLPQEMHGAVLTGRELIEATDKLRRIIMPDAKTVRAAVLSSDLGKSLDMAIDMEKESIAFYSEVAPTVLELDATVFQAIVAEEKRHLDKLQKVRKEFAHSPAEN